MHVLYHNSPGQRTLLITHSNQALNDLFEKILERDVPARYLLRLGMGEAGAGHGAGLLARRARQRHARAPPGAAGGGMTPAHALSVSRCLCGFKAPGLTTFLMAHPLS